MREADIYGPAVPRTIHDQIGTVAEDFPFDGLTQFQHFLGQVPEARKTPPVTNKGRDAADESQRDYDHERYD